MAYPIDLPQPRRRWHGPAPWKVATILMLVAGLSVAMLYYGRDLLGYFITKKPKVSRYDAGTALKSDEFTRASTNGQMPGAPVDKAALDREAKLQAALEASRKANEKLLARLEEISDRRDTQGKRDVGRSSEKTPAANSPEKSRKIEVKPPESLVYVAYDPEAQPSSQTYLGAGTVVNCTMTTATNSERQVVATAIVREHMRDSRNPALILMPQYSELILETDPTQVIAGNERLDARLARIRLPNRPSIEMPKEPMVDQIGHGGLPATVDRKWRYVLPALLLRGVFAASVEQVTNIGFAGLNGLQSAGNQIGQKISQPFINVRPTLKTEESDRCAVILTKDLALPVYHF